MSKTTDNIQTAIPDILYDDNTTVDTFNTLEYYNSFDDLNYFYVNSYDMDTEKIYINKPKKGIQIVSDKDQIRFVHEDEASDRHMQIHTETDKQTKTTADKTKPKKSANDKYAKKKEEIRQRLNNKSKEQTIKNVLDSIDRTYTTNKSKTYKKNTSYQSKTGSKTTKKKTSFGSIIILLFAIFTLFGPMVSSFFELIADEVDINISTPINQFIDDNSNEPELYTGNINDLNKIFEITDYNKENPFYYSNEGVLYDSSFYSVENDCEDYNFTKEDIAQIRTREYIHKHGDEEGFVCAFIDEKTHIAYYILDGDIYNCNDEIVDKHSVTLPADVLKKLDNYSEDF